MPADAVGDFSTASNPNGVWSYSAAGALLTQVSTGTGFVDWNDGENSPNYAYVAQNTSGSTISDLTIVDPTDALWLDPQGKPSVDVIYTAPTAGFYTISGQFLGIDTGENAHPVAITANGATVFDSTISPMAKATRSMCGNTCRPAPRWISRSRRDRPSTI